jgi:hypothetical protein
MPHVEARPKRQSAHGSGTTKANPSRGGGLRRSGLAFDNGRWGLSVVGAKTNEGGSRRPHVVSSRWPVGQTLSVYG